MKFRIVDNFPWPTVEIHSILSTGVDIVPPERLPNVSARKMLELRHDGANFYRKTEWCVHGQIPKVAQKFLSPDMLTFVEESEWDNAAGMFKTKITPHHMSHILFSGSTSRWKAIGDASTRREYEGYVDVKLPIIGPMVEKTIVNYLIKNTRENTIMLTEALAERLGNKGNCGCAREKKMGQGR